jgi:hypothetical protein
MWLFISKTGMATLACKDPAHQPPAWQPCCCAWQVVLPRWPKWAYANANSFRTSTYTTTTSISTAASYATSGGEEEMLCPRLSHAEQESRLISRQG